MAHHSPHDPPKAAPRFETTPPPETGLKPYAAPRLTEHGKVAAATADSTPPSEFPT